MRILFIAPLPPPITGHSIAAQVLLDGLKQDHQPDPVNLSEGTLHDGTVTARRVKEVGKVLLRVLRRRGADRIYLTISESKAGNLKDLFIYLACLGRLDRMTIHLHGGTIGQELFDRYPLLKRLNAAFIGRMGAVVISGKSHLGIFEGMIPRERVHMVPNFAKDELFVPEDAVPAKFAATQPIRVLYISAMIPMKGYQALADAVFSLDAEMRRRLQVDFAGKFDSAAEREAFEARLSGQQGIRYHGLVDDATKRRLFAEAHAFCLPSSFREGQPISILEAYASGCVVLTTVPSGVRDVFTPGENGFEIQASAESIAAVLKELVHDTGRMVTIAEHNRSNAERNYRTAIFNERVKGIVLG